MHKNNFREWEILRHEIETIRRCITSYMGLIFGGVGLAFFTMGSRAQDLLSKGAPGGTLVPLGIAALALGLVVTTVLFITCYKFLSHNRYSGYCKLLTHEHYTLKKDAGDVLAWEVCMDRVRQADFNKEHHSWIEFASSSNMPALTGLKAEDVRGEIKRVGGPAPESDVGGPFRGLGAVISGFLGNNSSTSWGFPLYVMMAYLALWTLIIMAGWWLIGSSPIAASGAQYVTATVVTAVGVIAWFPIFGKLWNVMMGSRTVDAYCWKFLPIRYRFLDEHYELVEYRVVRSEASMGA